MAGMTPQGKLYTLARQESLNGWHPTPLTLFHEVVKSLDAA
jgi:hypothetical protein